MNTSDLSLLLMRKLASQSFIFAITYSARAKVFGMPGKSICLDQDLFPDRSWQTWNIC